MLSHQPELWGDVPSRTSNTGTIRTSLPTGAVRRLSNAIRSGSHHPPDLEQDGDQISLARYLDVFFRPDGVGAGELRIMFTRADANLSQR